MPPPPDVPASPTDIRLPANGTTVAAEELRNQLVLAADHGAGTVIDASAVQNVGQAILQLLVAARRVAIGAGKPYVIASPSDAFRSRVNDCRLADAVGLPCEKGSAP